jgi:hypothetical protein
MGIIWRALKKKMFVYFVEIWSNLSPRGIYYTHFGNFVANRNVLGV